MAKCKWCGGSITGTLVPSLYHGGCLDAKDRVEADQNRRKRAEKEKDDSVVYNLKQSDVDAVDSRGKVFGKVGGSAAAAMNSGPLGYYKQQLADFRQRMDKRFGVKI